MEKKIEDYLHLYLGCDLSVFVMPILVDGKPYIDKIECLSSECATFSKTADYYFDPSPDYPNENSIKPILRPLSDMTIDEAHELLCLSPFYRDSCDIIVYKISENGFIGIQYKVKYHFKGRWWYKSQSISENLSPEYFIWLLKRDFDLFGLIESGLAISKVEVSNPLKNVE